MTTADSAAAKDWPGVRLHVVTGKGGTGKTTVAGALALALAGRGASRRRASGPARTPRVLLVEVEGRQGLAQLFDSPPLPYEERRVATVPGGGEVWALAIDPEQALLEYLDMFYKLGAAAKALKRFGAIDFATTVAPGIRDVLLTGKTCEAVRRRAREEGRTFHYDAVVMDAPPTGRITRFLNVNSEVSGLARVGPIHNQAEAVMRVLTSAQTAVHFATLLEEMPVQETLDGIKDLRAAGLPVGGIMVNQARDVVLTDAQLKRAATEGVDRVELSAGLAEVNLDRPPIVDALSALATEHAQRVLLELDQRESLSDCDAPIYELPLLNEGVDRVGLDRLATSLRDQGAA
ncbi:ATPase [Actinospica sp. MGRD01-02]|uniref:ATPase n=1 Tax=Actinospica acidithermotolerans TaxID=2828514 RepID=A0A941E6R0_9ACTN|nr:ArsA-related P-loop ATPase [Actinospica acidithermotolerans]MBR7826131.1 ATPase [Actinospica acidithermotolerans]